MRRRGRGGRGWRQFLSMGMVDEACIMVYVRRCGRDTVGHASGSIVSYACLYTVPCCQARAAALQTASDCAGVSRCRPARPRQPEWHCDCTAAGEGMGLKRSTLFLRTHVPHDIAIAVRCPLFARRGAGTDTNSELRH